MGFVDIIYILFLFVFLFSNHIECAGVLGNRNELFRADGEGEWETVWSPSAAASVSEGSDISLSSGNALRPSKGQKGSKDFGSRVKGDKPSIGMLRGDGRLGDKLASKLDENKANKSLNEPPKSGLKPLNGEKVKGDRSVRKQKGEQIETFRKLQKITRDVSTRKTLGGDTIKTVTTKVDKDSLLGKTAGKNATYLGTRNNGMLNTNKGVLQSNNNSILNTNNNSLVNNRNSSILNNNKNTILNNNNSILNNNSNSALNKNDSVLNSNKRSILPQPKSPMEQLKDQAVDFVNDQLIPELSDRISRTVNNIGANTTVNNIGDNDNLPKKQGVLDKVLGRRLQTPMLITAVEPEKISESSVEKISESPAEKTSANPVEKISVSSEESDPLPDETDKMPEEIDHVTEESMEMREDSTAEKSSSMLGRIMERRAGSRAILRASKGGIARQAPPNSYYLNSNPISNTNMNASMNQNSNMNQSMPSNMPPTYMPPNNMPYPMPPNSMPVNNYQSGVANNDNYSSVPTYMNYGNVPVQYKPVNGLFAGRLLGGGLFQNPNSSLFQNLGKLFDLTGILEKLTAWLADENTQIVLDRLQDLAIQAIEAAIEAKAETSENEGILRNSPILTKLALANRCNTFLKKFSLRKNCQETQQIIEDEGVNEEALVEELNAQENLIIGQGVVMDAGESADELLTGRSDEAEVAGIIMEAIEQLQTDSIEDTRQTLKDKANTSELHGEALIVFDQTILDLAK